MRIFRRDRDNRRVQSIDDDLFETLMQMDTARQAVDESEEMANRLQEIRRADELDCTCPRCGAPMVRRQNRRTGEEFAGCSAYPQCNGTRQIRNGEVVFQELESNDAPVLRSTRLTYEELERRVAELEEKMAEVIHYYQGDEAA